MSAKRSGSLHYEEEYYSVVYLLRDGTHSHDPARAMHDLIDASQGDYHENAFEAFVCTAGRAVLQALTHEESLAARMELEQKKAHRKVREGATAVLELLLEDSDSLRDAIPAPEAVDAFLKLSGALSGAVSSGVVLDNLPTQTLNDAAAKLLGFSAEKPEENPEYDVAAALERCSSTIVQEQSRRVLTDYIAWYNSDPIIRSLQFTIP